jgi:DNA polymerase elongation subunit (family B)
MNYNINELHSVLESKDKQAIVSYLQQHQLTIDNGKIVHSDKATAKREIEYWDKRQLVKKINLNSLYGAILNPHSRFFDHRIGQSTTLTGRAIAQHMDAHVNQTLTGEYNHVGECIIYGDTDSCDKDSKIKTSVRDMTIEELFHAGNEFYELDGKEYSLNDNIDVYHHDPVTHKSTLGKYNYVYRHRTSKRRFIIKTANGKEVTVTEDHSVMILKENGDIVEVKPMDINKGDKVITII